MTNNPIEVHQDHVSPPGNKSHALLEGFQFCFILSAEGKGKVEGVFSKHITLWKDKTKTSLLCLHLPGRRKNNHSKTEQLRHHKHDIYHNDYTFITITLPVQVKADT